MIRHQTVPEDPKAGPSRVFQQQLEVNPAQGIGQEDVAASVPALSDMMREASRDGPRCSGHAEPVHFAEIFLKETSRPSLVPLWFPRRPFRSASPDTNFPPVTAFSAVCIMNIA